MGIIINQSIKNTIITYLGFGIGGLNTIFLYTNFLEKEYYGLVSYLLTTSNLIWPLMAFGMHNTLIKFFSSYTDTDQRDRFMWFVLVLPLGTSGVLGMIGYFCYHHILSYFEGENAIVQPYLWTIYVIALAMAYFEIFFAWAKVQLKSVFGNFMKEVFHRFAVAILLFAVYFEVLSVSHFIYALVVVYILRLISIKLYAFRLHFPKFHLALPQNYKEVLLYSTLILLAGSIAIIMIELDKFMIQQYLPIGDVAVYGMCAYIASVIIVPSRAMHQITYPLTAKLLNEQNYRELHILYKQTSLSLLVISGLMFLLIICNVRELYELVPDDYQLFMIVVVLIGLAKVCESLLGNNNAILFSSKYYKSVLVLGIILAISAVGLNILLIPMYGVNGAAVATFLAVSVYNILKIYYVKQKFAMTPLSVNTFKTLFVLVVFAGAFYTWDFSFHPILNIISKSALLGVSYACTIYYLKLSVDVNRLLEKIGRLLRKWMG